MLKFKNILIGIIFLKSNFINAQEININDTLLWVSSPLKFVTASVKLPSTSSLEKKDIYTSKGLQSLYYLKSDFKTYELSFTASMRQVNSKEYKKALQEEVNRLAVQFGGYPNTFKEIDNNNLNYDYVVIKLSDKKIVESRIYFIDDYLVMLTTVSPDKDKFGAVVQYFFNSFVYTRYNNNNITANTKPTQNKKNSKEPIWQAYNDSTFFIKFPAEPTIKKYFVETNEQEKYIVNNYYLQFSENNSAYLISERKYNYVLDISADSLFNLAIKTLSENQKSKLISEQYFYAYKFPIKEYIFSSRKVFYRLRYCFAYNTLYQILYSGSKKQVLDLKNETFFSSFVIK